MYLYIIIFVSSHRAWYIADAALYEGTPLNYGVFTELSL